MAIKQSGTTIVSNNKLFTLGTATPGSPTTGLIRYNSSLTQFEVYNGSAWVSMIASGPVLAALYSWGRNTNTRLGAGLSATESRSSPVSVTGGYTDWLQVAAGGFHSVGIRANGTAWAWGDGAQGKLGTNNDNDATGPTAVVGGFTWIQISSGLHTGAIRSDGTAWCWGYNNSGQLGNDSIVTRSSPVSVVGGFTDWTQISAATYRHTAGLRADGSIWCWGRNTEGQLGDDTKVSSRSPVSVVGGFAWTQVSAGFTHNIAIQANGTAWGWGGGVFGAIGQGSYGSASQRSSPMSVVGDFSDWAQVSAGRNHSLGVRANGSLWAWGRNNSGQLGNNNSSINRSSPISVIGGFTDWVQVSAGNQNSAALRANGTAWTWGRNTDSAGTTGFGNLGTNDIITRSSPVSVVGGFTDWVQISMKQYHTVALRTASI